MAQHLVSIRSLLAPTAGLAVGCWHGTSVRPVGEPKTVGPSARRARSVPRTKGKLSPRVSSFFARRRQQPLRTAFLRKARALAQHCCAGKYRALTEEELGAIFDSWSKDLEAPRVGKAWPKYCEVELRSGAFKDDEVPLTAAVPVCLDRKPRDLDGDGLGEALLSVEEDAGGANGWIRIWSLDPEPGGRIRVWDVTPDPPCPKPYTGKDSPKPEIIELKASGIVVLRFGCLKENDCQGCASAEVRGRYRFERGRLVFLGRTLIEYKERK